MSKQQRSSKQGSKKTKPNLKQLKKQQIEELRKRLNEKWSTEIETTDLKEVIYEDINDTYAKALLGPFDLIMDKTNGYFNASKMCSYAIKLGDNKKHFNEWFLTGRSKNIKINYVN